MLFRFFCRRSLPWRVRLVEISALASSALAATAAAQPMAGRVIATGADANSCAALAAESGRLASKYTLGQRACVEQPDKAAPSTSPAPVAPLPRSRQAQQLYLYESPTDVLPAAPPVPSATMPPRAGRTERGRPALVPPLPPPNGIVPSGRRPTAPTPSRTITRALQLAPTVDAAARAHDIDPLLLHAIARVESRHDPGAVSHAGARGVMQVMPTTAQRFGVGSAQALHHAPTNLQVSAVYLKTLQARFGNNLPLVLAAYNAGEGAVQRHGNRIPPYAETQQYVRDVLAEYRRLRAAVDAKGLM